MIVDVRRRAAPRSGFKHWFAGLVLRLGGWTMGGAPPAVPKMVVVAAPHTVLRDGFWMVAFAWWWGIRLQWVVKSDLSGGPVGWFLRQVGAVPVQRSAPQGQVTLLAKEISRAAEIVLSIAPEGTRARRDVWKSGFYHIAREAKVPICLSYLDYGRSEAGFGPCFMPSGDIRADMDIVREFYQGVQARHPELFTPPRLREEDELPAAVPPPAPRAEAPRAASTM